MLSKGGPTLKKQKTKKNKQSPIQYIDPNRKVRNDVNCVLSLIDAQASMNFENKFI